MPIPWNHYAIANTTGSVLANTSSYQTILPEFSVSIPPEVPGIALEINDLLDLLDIRTQNEDRVDDETREKIKKVFGAMMLDSNAADYFPFVLACSTNFSIYIIPTEEIIFATPEAGANLARDGFEETRIHFSPATRTLFIGEERLENNDVNRDVPRYLRKEIRTAYWLAVQHQLGGDPRRINVNCFNEAKGVSKEKVDKAVALGISRVKKLEKLLQKEFSNKKLSYGEKDKLKNERALLDGQEGHYEFSITLPASPARLENYCQFIGKAAVTSDDWRFGDFYVLACDNKQQTVRIKFTDPLRVLAYTVNLIEDRCAKSIPGYNDDTKAFQMEAALRSVLPVSLVGEYFPELLELTEKLGSQALQRVCGHPVAPGEDFYDLFSYFTKTHENIFSNPVLLDFEILKAPEVVINKIKAFLASEDGQAIPAGVTLSDLNEALEKLTNRSLTTLSRAEVNRLQGEVLNLIGNNRIQRDGSAICRFYHRAFKKGADFQYEDYNTCLENLIEQKRYGDANQVVKKAVQKYERLIAQERFPKAKEKLQEELDLLNNSNDRIKELRSGSSSSSSAPTRTAVTITCRLAAGPR